MEEETKKALLSALIAQTEASKDRYEAMTDEEKEAHDKRTKRSLERFESDGYVMEFVGKEAKQ